MAGTETRQPEASFESRDSGYITLERQALESRNQDIFCQSLEHIRQSQIGLLPNLSEGLDHTGKTTVGLSEKLDEFGKPVLFSPGTLEQLSQNRFPDRINFRPHPLMRLGREDSFRSVFFGQLEQQWFHEGKIESIDIAIKPVPRNELDQHKLLHEIAMYQYAAKLGLPTFEVLGYVKNTEAISASEPIGFVLTKYEPDVTTLDGLEWGEMDEAEARQNLGHAVETAALLHSNYLFTMT